MYDYVIVGAGSAGCVLAARLSEDPEVRVCLVEAGGEDTDMEIHIPAGFGALFKSRRDWDYSTEPEAALGGRRMYLPRGKMLGGCSSMNAMIYIRGNRVDFDEWAAAGAAGWGYEDVLPYFLQSEDNERGESMHHGAGGELSVMESRSMHPLATAFVEAAKQAGHEENPDFNGARQEGVGRYQVTQRDGMRESAAAAFLRPAEDRPNLTIVTDALVSDVIIENGRATGVRVDHPDHDQLLAEREVILSAGAYGSAQILMLSGIGPAAQLEALGLDVVADLPVGQNLQDHCMVLLNYVTEGVESLLTAMTDENVELLGAEGTGPLTSNIGEAGGFIRTRAGLDGPDCQFHCAPVAFFEEGLGLTDKHCVAFGPGVVKPTSRGELTLRGPSPYVKPRIVHNFLGSPEDRATIVAGLRAALQIAEQPALRAVITGELVVPAADASDEELLEFAKDNLQTIYHPTSTCAIGAVVDPELKLLGIEGLRVADASIMPTIVRGNTNAACIMIGEKAAAMIKQDALREAPAVA
ncbi:choline dehydrogenase [Conexibacter sp. W3-3-2]|uniref:GMC family oxidoreductase n=1 Tax=Conexibacter sp. W3-3-2 TaxID=2675227 RepID=UPI0012B94675|nr:GMC family oxidoreductase N-terminal domain-containing protein [Conexibacter sp. W3-3-2]MTD45935.1 choline dehydrogenase [Conexibacter sp. W3-3-2]